MPIQISELNISVSVNQPGPAQNTGAAGPENGGNENVVEECVEQIMKILQDKKER